MHDTGVSLIALLALLILAACAVWLISATFEGAGIIWKKADSTILRLIIIVLWLTAFPVMAGISLLVGLFHS